MRKFKATIQFTINKTVNVQAESPSEAFGKVRRLGDAFTHQFEADPDVKVLDKIDTIEEFD